MTGLRDICPDCKRPVANVDDEGDHNTGACGCKLARSICWRVWNGDRCTERSPYDEETHE